MKIGIIGTGYVGLVSGVCFASAGNAVTCVDANPDIVSKLSQGQMTIYEPGLESLLQQTTKEGRIVFTTDIEKTVQRNDVLFIAVGTPMNQDRSADLSAIKAVAASIGTYNNGHKIVVTKSTVPVGTGDMIEKIISSKTLLPFDVVSNPEFLKEGCAVEDFLRPDRIVVGYNPGERSDIVHDKFLQLYRPFTMNSGNLLFMDRTSAELTKYAANAMLAVRISFMNDMARLAEKVGANIDSIRNGIGADKRIGPSFLFAGPGYGGSCFPKDVAALVKTGAEYGSALHVVDAAQRSNELQQEWFVNKILSHYGGNISGKTIALWGLAFKAKTDDVRLSPAITVASRIVDAGGRVIAYDPQAHETTRRVLGDSITYAPTQYDCFPADALVVMTDWNEFKSPDFSSIQLRDKLIVDSRNLWDLPSMKKQPFKYISIGRPTIH